MTTMEPPAHLSPSARQLWTTTVETYVLHEHHLRILQLLCEAWDRSQQARERLDREGLIVPGAEGGVKTHPALWG
jgi:P27 family predicted phage terminase small subunit